MAVIPFIPPPSHMQIRCEWNPKIRWLNYLSLMDLVNRSNQLNQGWFNCLFSGNKLSLDGLQDIPTNL